MAQAIAHPPGRCAWCGNHVDGGLWRAPEWWAVAGLPRRRYCRRACALAAASAAGVDDTAVTRVEHVDAPQGPPLTQKAP